MNKRTLLTIRLKFLSLLGKNDKKVNLIRKSGLFKSFGEGGYWHPDWIPSFPEYISIGNNVTVAADVRIYEHDMIQRMWNNDPTYSGGRIHIKKDFVSIGDNTVLGARSIILYGVNIGKNVVVASGSVVTKDIPDFSIVAGCPAKVIGNTKDLFKRRLAKEGVDVTAEDYCYDNYFKKV